MKYTRNQLATAIAILFHTIGLAGLLFSNRIFFLRSTAVNLLLMLILLLWTQHKKNRYFFLFLAICFFAGISIEITGVHTGLFFGHYSYGTVMGYEILDVPLVIGVNWFILVYCSGMALNLLIRKGAGPNQPDTGKSGIMTRAKAAWIIFGGALLAVLYDWLMEPVALKLGYWHWDTGLSVPFYNYVCWFIASALLLSVFLLCKFDKRNKFAVNLLLIQLVFFLLLRIFLD